MTRDRNDDLGSAHPSTLLVPQGVSGLTAADVAERVAQGRVNVSSDTSSRTLGQILRGNIFTLFNGILAACFVVILFVGELKNALFGFVIIINAAIGVIQEYRAKRTLDRLAVLHAPLAKVVRDGNLVDIDTQDIVEDDLLLLATGDQIPVDAEVLAVSGAEVDESLLTGESDPLVKQVGDSVMSGSFVVAGSLWVRADAVGAQAYANRLTSEARRFSLVHSEIRDSINSVLKIITWIIGPVIALLVWSQISAHGGWAAAWADGSWRDAVTSAVSGIIGMIPEGLVLLTSISFGLAAIVLARRMVLVQELPAVEVLARVDVVCLDKTGTLTEGEIVAESVIDVGVSVDPVARDAALHALAIDPGGNATARALAAVAVAGSSVPVDYTVPFSSARKWSALLVGGRQWIFGAPEVILAGRTDEAARGALAVADAAAAEGRRSVLLAISSERLTAESTIPAVDPVAVVRFREKIRPDAAETLAYFADQGVSLRVISGDNPITVAAIAREVGLVDAVGFDARQLPQDLEALADVLEEHRVFGRVTPEQKRAMVHALQARGHTVAMTGDGVNDALALKDADLGIAMGSGAGATKAVARIVLLDGRFSRLPGVVAEGRRVIANIERVSNLFLTKTAYAILIAVVVAIAGTAYPFDPIQMTLISSLTIGIPGFFLALAPNKQRYRPGFLARVLSFAAPAGLVAAAATLFVYLTLDADGMSRAVSCSAATLTLGGIGLCVLATQARPWAWWRLGLVLAMLLGFIGAATIPFVRAIFELQVPTGLAAVLVLAVVATAGVAVWSIQRFLTPWVVTRVEARRNDQR